VGSRFDRTGDGIQVVEHLPHKPKAPSSNSSTAKKKKRKSRKGTVWEGGEGRNMSECDQSTLFTV
jgi:hypothetical protein